MTIIFLKLTFSFFVLFLIVSTLDHYDTEETLVQKLLNIASHSFLVLTLSSFALTCLSFIWST